MSQMPEDGSSPYGDLPYVMSGLKRKNTQYDRQRQLAYGMIQGGMDFSPIQHPMQGVSRLAQALVGSLMASRADSQEAEADKIRQAEFGKAMTIADPQERLAAIGKIDPEMGMRFSAQMAMQEAKAKRDAEEARANAESFGGSYGLGGGGAGGPAQAIASIESGGRYDAMGVEVPGQGRAHGKYQVMPANIGPWTKEILGQELTPQQFLASPQAQDAVFQGKFGQYIKQYGSPEAAARAWFAGPGGMNNPNARDPLGTSVADYSRKFTAAGGAGPQVAQGDNVLPSPRPPGSVAPGAMADGSGNPLPPQGPARATELPKPEPDMALVARARDMVARKMMTPVQADQMIREDMNRRWQIAVTEASADRRQAAADTAATAREEAKGPQKAFDNATTLRKEYSSEPVVKQYRTVVPMLETAKDATTRPSRAADINLVYAFAKLMDPDSVVRESETGMLMATGTVADKLGSYLGQLNGGSMLKPETRANLIRELESRFGPMQESYNQLTSAYGKIAESAGLPREHVILPVRQEGKGPRLPSAVQPQGQQQMPVVNSPAEAARLPKGTQFRDPDGNVRVVP